MRKWCTALVAALFLAVALAGCAKPASQPVMVDPPYQDTQFLMGTVVTLRIYDQGKRPVLKKAFARIAALADAITVNEKGSEVDAINQQAGIKPVKVSPAVFKLVQAAKKTSVSSGGAFDLAIGPITNLWHIGFPDARKPAQAEIDAALPLVRYQDVALNAKNRTVFLKRKGMALDLGGIAKGFITDEATAVLRKNGVTTAILDLGGNIYVLGNSPKGKAGNWTVGIQDPKAGRGTPLGTITAKNQTIVTSGIYERYLEVAGQTYMHLMNPHTGYPFANELMGVSIVAATSLTGDALSTAAFDKGLTEGLAFINKQPNVEAIFVTKDKKVYLTDGLKGTFKLAKSAGYTLATGK